MAIFRARAAALAKINVRVRRRLRNQVSGSPLLHEAAFHHSSLSIWVDDWSEVGRFVLSLRAAGENLVTYFAERPQLMRHMQESVRVVDVNQATVELFGAINKEALIGRLIDVVPALLDTFGGWMASISRGDKTYRAETRIRNCDGSVRDCLVMAALPFDQAGFDRLLVTVLDVTDYKADQARLAKAERDAASVSRLLTVGVLTGSIAHEVNNPLAAAITNAEAALRWLERPQPNHAEATSAIRGAVQAARQAQMVVERTRQLFTDPTVSVTELDLSHAFGITVLLLERELDEAGVTVRIVVDPATPHVMADPVRVQQVLINLIQNAARSACIASCRTIFVHAEPHRQGALVSVHDEGAGIAPEVRDRLFEPFVSTRDGGTGMGLAVCKACVEAHGGRIWAESTPGHGATFLFTLPARQAPDSDDGP